MNDDQELTPQHQDELFSILSLDVTKPFYENIALPLAVRDHLSSHIRTCVKQNRSEIGQEPFVLLGCLKTKLIAKDFKNFSRWAKHAFLGIHSDQPELSAWNLAIGQWFSQREWPPNVPSHDMEWLVNLARLEANSSLNAVQRKQADARMLPLSNWDVSVYNLHDWNNAHPFKQPFTTLSNMASTYATQKVLRAANKRFSPGTLEQLREAAQITLQKDRVWMPGPLETIQKLVQQL